MDGAADEDDIKLLIVFVGTKMDINFLPFSVLVDFLNT
jgi:hypothetical protein